MEIIAYKNDLTNYVDFFKNIIHTDYIDGFQVPVTKTKDNKIIVFDDKMGDGNWEQTEILQKSTITDLQLGAYFDLKNLLDELSKIPLYNKKIIINVYPLITPPLSNETTSYINNLNNAYVTEIKNVIDQYPKLDISLSCVNNHLLQAMKRIITDRPMGLIVLGENLNYIASDFFILKPIMLDEIIIKQELDNGIEIMISIMTGDDLSLAYSFFNDNPNDTKKEILLKLTFITSYPELFNNLFNKR